MRAWVSLSLATLGCHACVIAKHGSTTQRAVSASPDTRGGSPLGPTLDSPPAASLAPESGKKPSGPSALDPAASGPAATGPIAPSDPLVVFVDGFTAHWRVSHAWAGMLIETVASPAVGTLAIHAKSTDAWDAAAFVHVDDNGDPASLTSNDLAAVTFSVMGSGTLLVSADNGSTEATLALTPTWTTHVLQRSAFAGNGLPYSQINFKATAADQEFYLDDIRFSPNDTGGDTTGGTTGSTTDNTGGAGATPRISGAGNTDGSLGCGKSGATGTNLSLDMTIAGLARHAAITVPESYDKNKAYPIVFGFHGCGDNAENAHNYIVSDSEAQGQAIFVYPKAYGSCFYGGYAGTDGDKDAALFIEMRARMRNDYCIDLKRTFVSGFSSGGILSHTLACRFGADEITAFAPNAGALGASGLPVKYNAAFHTAHPDYPYWQDEFMCPSDGDAAANPTKAPKLPPPSIMFHGTADDAVSLQSGRDAAQHWAFSAKCTEDPLQMTPTAGDPCVRPACAVGHEVEWCEIPGMGHSIWYDGNDSAPQRIWTFFARY